jgi:Aerotolerance regulator N-terminal/von Willebrand factor type A domain
MNFLFPAAFFLGSLALPIVVLYLRRPSRRPLEFSSLLFWQRVLEREPHRKFLGRLRNPLSLILQLVILLLLLLALARPQELSSQGHRSTVLVLDMRARMQVPGIFDEAVLAAQDVISRLGPHDELAILGMEGVPRIISSFSSDGKELRRKLSSLEPSDAGGNLNEALVLAGRLLDAKPGEKRLIVIGDRKAAAPENAEQISVGKATDNLAVLSLAQRPLPASPQSAELMVRLANFSRNANSAELELSLDGKPFDLQRFPLGAGEQRDFSTVIPKEMLASGTGFLIAKLTSEDALKFDNSARAVLPTGRQLRVLLMGEDDPFLENALKADPSIAVEILRPESWRSTLGAGFDVIVFDNWLPADLASGKVGSEPSLFFGRTPFNLAGEEISPDFLEASESDSPLLWNVEFRDIRLAKAEKLAAPADGRWRASIPMRSAGEPMVMALEGPEGARVVAVAFAVADSNFPLRVGFPLFVSNVVHWLAERRSRSDTILKAGSTFFPKDGEEIRKDPLSQPQADREINPSTSSQTPSTLRKNGFYQVRGSEGIRWLAVNTSDATESDVRAAGSENESLAFTRKWGALQPWRWLALAALVLLAVEWPLHHRRVTE